MNRKARRYRQKIRERKAQLYVLEQKYKAELNEWDRLIGTRGGSVKGWSPTIARGKMAEARAEINLIDLYLVTQD